MTATQSTPGGTHAAYDAHDATTDRTTPLSMHAIPLATILQAAEAQDPLILSYILCFMKASSLVPSSCGVFTVAYIHDPCVAHSPLQFVVAPP
jgi:hypothetical protein